MTEVSYINLACQVLGIEPSTLLKSRETEDGVVIINNAGKKFKFSFEYLEDYKQYVEDNRPKTRSQTTKKRTAAKKAPAKGAKLVAPENQVNDHFYIT